MPQRQMRSVVAVVVGSVLFAACGESHGPASRAVAPPVGHPVDPAPFRARPCGVLTEQQLSGLGFAPGSVAQAATDAVGPQCSWSAKGTYNHLGIILRDDWKGGLSALYARKDSLGYFDEVSVDALPAVFAFDRDERPAGSCVINVGLSDDAVLYVQFVAVAKADVPMSCEKTRTAAEAAVDTLRHAR